MEEREEAVGERDEAVEEREDAVEEREEAMGDREEEVEEREETNEGQSVEAMCSYVSCLRTPPSLFWLDLNSQPLRYEEDTLHSGLIHGGSAITVYIIYILYRLHDGNENTRIQNCIATVNALIYTQISLMFIYRKCGSLVYC